MLRQLIFASIVATGPIFPTAVPVQSAGPTDCTDAALVSALAHGC